MKVLFIVNMEDLGFEEPLGVLYLSAVAKQHGHRVYAVDNSLPRIEKKIKDIQPDVLAVSVITPSFPYLFETVVRVKAKYHIPTVFGGCHITFFPEVVKHGEIDYAFRGECEGIFVEFLNLLEKGKEVRHLENLVTRGPDGSIRQNPLRPLVQDLDTIPFPDRELFAEYPQFYKAEVKSVIASRGCVYNCSYCFNKQYNELYAGSGGKIHLRSVDNVVQECLQLKERYHAQLIHFFDDIFPFRRDWLGEFTEKYPKKVGLPFITNTHFDICTKEYIESLSRAGCKTLFMGVETGNEELRERILHRKMSNKMMIERADLIHRYGMKIYAQNLIGLPMGSLAKDIETLKLNIDLKADFSGAYLCQPYPKTEIEAMARQMGLLDDDSVIARSFYYPSPLKLPQKKEIERLRPLFSIIVAFPFLYRHTYALLAWPGFPFKMFFSFLHGYKIKTVILRYHMGLGGLLKGVYTFFARKTNNMFYAVKSTGMKKKRD
jgi:anaerobic magnesium-protoporphyrin IX monomethyl ester cyclase